MRKSMWRGVVCAVAYAFASGAAIVLGGCKSGTDTTDEATFLEVVSGNSQTVQPGSALPLPFRVRVTDRDHNPVQGVTISWTVASGGGALTPGSSTNVDGETAATFVAGQAVGAQTVTAQATGLGISSVNFSVTVTVGGGGGGGGDL